MIPIAFQGRSENEFSEDFYHTSANDPISEKGFRSGFRFNGLRKYIRLGKQSKKIRLFLLEIIMAFSWLLQPESLPEDVFIMQKNANKFWWE